MFGLEQQKKPKNEEFVFELEREFKDPTKQKDIKARIEAMIQKLKDILRTGGTQDEFDEYGLLLHGYTSILKVMTRCVTTKGKK